MPSVKDSYNMFIRLNNGEHSSASLLLVARISSASIFYYNFPFIDALEIQAGGDSVLMSPDFPVPEKGKTLVELLLFVQLHRICITPIDTKPVIKLSRITQMLSCLDGLHI